MMNISKRFLRLLRCSSPLRGFVINSRSKIGDNFNKLDVRKGDDRRDNAYAATEHQLSSSAVAEKFKILDRAERSVIISMAQNIKTSSSRDRGEIVSVSMDSNNEITLN